MNLVHTLLAVLVTVLWGFAFVVIKVGLTEFPPLLFAALRFVMVAFPAILFMPRQGIPWRWIIVIGMAMGTLQFGLLYIGMKAGMPAGLSSVVIQSQVLFTLVLSAWVLHDVPRRQQWLGVGLAIAGIVIIAFEQGEQSSLSGLLLVMGAAISWAVGNICIKVADVGNGFRLLVWMALIPPVPLVGLSLLFESDQWMALRSLTLLGVGTLLYTGWIASLLCFGFWAYLVQHYSPNRVAPFSSLVPVFGLAFSALLLGDRLTALEVIGSMLVFVGLCCTVLTSPIRLNQK